MAQYIDKSALVAEIDRRIKVLQNHPKENHKTICYLDSLKQFLNTFEMKDVDLKKELDYNDYTSFFKEHPDYSNGDWGFDECWVFAEYFYKLGIKAQRGE